MEKDIQGDPGVKGVTVPNGNNLTDVVMGEGVFWIYLAQEEDMLNALMNTEIKTSLLKRREFFG
jgi:hypothetical protein